MIINTFCAYPFFLLPAAFPNSKPLGLSQQLFGFAELAGHAIGMPIIAKRAHAPGEWTSLLLWLPIGGTRRAGLLQAARIPPHPPETLAGSADRGRRIQRGTQLNAGAIGLLHDRAQEAYRLRFLTEKYNLDPNDWTSKLDFSDDDDSIDVEQLIEDEIRVE